MIPYKIREIKTYNDVQNVYPDYYKEEDFKDRRVKKYTQEELNSMIETELYKCDLAGEVPPSKLELRLKYIVTAEARGLYKFYWCIDHITDQLVKLGFIEQNVPLLLSRMQNASYNPWSVTEDTVAQFIKSSLDKRHKHVSADDYDNDTCEDEDDYDSGDDDTGIE